MYELRVCFTREERVKYISHLDIMKVFERAIRRANIKISYSKGFNPHPQIIFGLPMGVGLSSTSEYADISLDENLSAENFKNTINQFLPEGFKVTQANQKLSKGNIMSSITAARYEVFLSVGCPNEGYIIQDKLNEFLAKDVVMFLKENKNGKKYIDIRALILDIQTKKSCGDDCIIFDMLLKAGQKDNLKPEYVITAFSECSKLEIDLVSVKRTELFVSIDNQLSNPMDSRILLQSG